MNITQIYSPNHSNRQEQIRFIIIHYTEMVLVDALKRLCDPVAQVSAHYVIKENGEILQLVDDKKVAWHAGTSYWQGLEKLNNYSIGIELDNLGRSAYNAKQMESCALLCRHLAKLYDIPPANILGHSDIAPDRKIDPGIFFDWQYMAAHQVGLWHNVNDDEDSLLAKFGDEGKQVESLQGSLKAMGYQIMETGIFDYQTNCVVRSFQSHFYPNKLRKLGVDFYGANTSYYDWNTSCDKSLAALLTKSVSNILGS